MSYTSHNMTNWQPTRRDLVQSIPVLIGINSKIGGFQANTNSDAEGWPMGHHDKGRTSSSDTLEAPGIQLEEAWSRNLGGTARDIRIVNGTVFANGYALNAETGDGIWSGSMNTFHDGQIYAEREGDLCQIEPSSGDVNWSLSLEIGEGSIDAMIGWEDSIIVGVNVSGSRTTGKIYSISLNNREQEWVRDRISPGGFAAAGGSLYFVDYSGSYPSLHSIDLDDGSTNYNTETSSINVGRPTVHENTVYLSDSYGDLMAFGANLGTKKWKFSDSTDGFGSPAVTNEYVICPLGDKVVCLSHDMSVNWEFQVEQGWGSYGQGGVSVVSDRVYFGTYGEIFYIVDLHSGEKLNSFEISSGIRGAPAIADNKVFFPTEDGTLYTLTDQPNQDPDPSFSYSPKSPRVDTKVTFDAGNSTDDQTIAEYNWNFEDSNVSSDTGEVVSKIFETPGTKRVELTVTDNQDASATSSKNVEVVRANQVPEPIISHSPEEAEVGEVVTFEGTASSDPDGAIETYEWNIDQDPNSGYHAGGNVVEYTFDDPGKKSVKLRVTDDDGFEATTEKQIQVVQQQVNFKFTGTETEITIDENAIITLSIVNFLSNEEVTVQLLINTPNGVSVSGVAGADSGSNQYTAVKSIDPGRQSDIRIHLEVNEPGNHTVNGLAMWYRGDDENNVDRYTDSLTIQAQSGNPSTDGVDQNSDSTSSETPGFGISAALGGVGGSATLMKWLHDRHEQD